VRLVPAFFRRSVVPCAVMIFASLCSLLCVCCCLVRGFDGASLRVDFVQELVSSFVGHMPSNKCSMCKQEVPFAGYDGSSKETLQKVRNSLDQLRVALLLNDTVFSVDGSGKVQPSAWMSAQHHQMRSCLVVGNVDNSSARIDALDAEIDARLRGHTSGGRGFEAPNPILATRRAWVGSPGV
jgi:hypothetical protein